MGEILPQTLDELGIAGRVKAERVRRVWDEAVLAVAPELAGGAQPAGIHGGTLSVRLSEPHLAALLQARRADLRRALNERLGEGAITEVVQAR
jgi:predicted nucleic acid-binding Zn ribbon protein